jgi:hypothetical protein
VCNGPLNNLNNSSAELYTFDGTRLASRRTQVKQFLRDRGYEPSDYGYRNWKKLFKVLAVSGAAVRGAPRLDVLCHDWHLNEMALCIQLCSTCTRCICKHNAF